jgi:ATP-dependent DNA helicase RecG
MLAALRQAGMSPPQFADRIATFQVTFPNHTLLDAETLRWLETVDAFDLTDSQRMALALLKRGEEVTNASYRQTSGLDSRVVTRELGDLVQRRLVDQAGTGRWTSYRLASAPPPATPSVSRRRRADRRGEIVTLLGKGGELSRAEIAQRLGVSDETAGRWLSRLRAERIVDLTTRSSRDPNAKYRLSKPGGESTSSRTSS